MVSLFWTMEGVGTSLTLRILEDKMVRQEGLLVSTHLRIQATVCLKDSKNCLFLFYQKFSFAKFG